jgi:hypothetical protein
MEKKQLFVAFTALNPTNKKSDETIQQLKKIMDWLKDEFTVDLTL